MANGKSDNTFPVDIPSDGAPAPIKPLPAPPYLPPIVADYPPPPPIVSVVLPNPTALKVVVQKPVSNTTPMIAARPGDPIPYIFGRCIVDPILITADDSTAYVIIDVLWSVGECDYIEYLITNNENQGRGDALGHIEHFEGAVGQATSPMMIAAKGSYDALSGICHTVMRRRSTRDVLNFRAMVRGLKLFDPRPSPTVTTYSTNPALALARVLSDSGYTMDWSSVGEAANYCDELIGSPQEKRWEIGMQISNRRPLREWVQALSVYANCYVEIQGGTAYLVPDKPRASNHTVTAADMLAGTVSVSRGGGRDVPERVSVSYTPITETGDPTWVALAETRTAETATSADAGTTSVIQLPGIQEYSRARRLATMVYNKSRNDLRVEFTSFDVGLQRTIGDVGTITNAQYGISAATMTLIENIPVDRGRWRRTYIDYDTSNYSDALFTEPAYNQTLLQNPNSPPTGPTPTLTQINGTDALGATIATIQIVFTGVSWPYIYDYYVTAVGDDAAATVVYDGFVEHDGAVTHTVYSGEVVNGVTYTVSVWCRSSTFALSSTPGTADITIALPDILWSTTPLSISNIDDGTDSGYSPQAAAAIYFWDYHYEFPDCTAATYQINTATFGSVRLISHDFLIGEYLVKYVIVPTASPAPTPPTVYVNGVAGQQGVWYDLYQAGIRIQDTVDDETANTVVLDITVAKSDGASPWGALAGTEKTKRCTFTADYGNEPFVIEKFTGANGTDIDTTTFFTTMFGDPEIQSNKAKGGSTASPAHTSGNHAATLKDDWALFADAKCQAIFNVGAAMTGTFGLLGRQADAPNAGNCFQIALTNCDTANPVLTLQEMSGTGAGMTDVVDRGMVILTGEGPFNRGTGQYFSITMELECVGTSIVGRMWTPMIGIPYSISYTSSTYSTQTRWGFRISGVNDGWCDDFKVYAMGPYPVTAKHLDPAASPGNYYRSTQYNGLIPATGSGDNYAKMTLVFCVYLTEHAAGVIFSDVSRAFVVECYDTNGTFRYTGKCWDNSRKTLYIESTGSPNNSVWPVGQWHSVMLVYDSNLVSSPQTENVALWIDGAEIHNGPFTSSDGPDSVFSPMGISGACYAGNGSYDPSPVEYGLNCYISYVWCAETALNPATHWSKFFDENNKPKWIGAQGEDAYGTIPASYFPHGNFTNNLGSGPDWTQVGTVADAPSSPSD